MFGWVLNWKPLTSPCSRRILMHEDSSERTSRDIVPWISKFSIPPSFSRLQLTFSSTAIEISSCGTGGAAGPRSGSSPKSSSSALSASRNALDPLDLPSCIPFFGIELPERSLDACVEREGLSKAGSGLERGLDAKGSSWKEDCIPKPMLPPSMPPPIFLSSFVLSISLAFFFITSLVSLILLWMIILCSFSSCDSISVYCFTCCTVTFSLWPREITSSNAKIRSNAAPLMLSSSRACVYSGISLASMRNVSRSSKMFDCLFVTSTRYIPSMG
mmetsp:Transcript_9258/g.33942  ORF Transcript_9258/g.33942 Transcript_9258/m.33942 type:complete len:273 (-) Transcript_9258:407-1225(-)